LPSWPPTVVVVARKAVCVAPTVAVVARKAAVVAPRVVDVGPRAVVAGSTTALFPPRFTVQKRSKPDRRRNRALPITQRAELATSVVMNRALSALKEEYIEPLVVRVLDHDVRAWKELCSALEPAIEAVARRRRVFHAWRKLAGERRLAALGGH